MEREVGLLQRVEFPKHIIDTVIAKEAVPLPQNQIQNSSNNQVIDHWSTMTIKDIQA